MILDSQLVNVFSLKETICNTLSVLGLSSVLHHGLRPLKTFPHVNMSSHVILFMNALFKWHLWWFWLKSTVSDLYDTLQLKGTELIKSGAVTRGNSHSTVGNKRRKMPNSDFPSDLKIIGEAKVCLSIYTGRCMFSRVKGTDECNCESLRKFGSCLRV